MCAEMTREEFSQLTFEEQNGAELALRNVLAWSKEEQCGREDVEQYIEECLAGLREESAQEEISPYARFDRDVERLLGRRIRASREEAIEFWSALANVGWFHESQPEQEVSYSFRAAGGLIAQIRAEGDYLDWYMSGPDGVVAPWIREVMATKGWRAQP
jgi:hypothetical protein